MAYVKVIKYDKGYTIQVKRHKDSKWHKNIGKNDFFFMKDVGFSEIEEAIKQCESDGKNREINTEDPKGAKIKISESE